MRLLFGRILAGEIKNPGSFSLRTVVSLSLLAPGQHIADRFCTFCNLALDMRNLGGAVTVCDIDKPISELKDFGLPYKDLVRLVEHGLVRTDLDSYWEMPHRETYKERLPFRYADMTVWLDVSQDTTPDNLPSTFRFSGPALTQIGEELKDILSLQADKEYTKALRDWLKSKHLTMY